MSGIRLQVKDEAGKLLLSVKSDGLGVYAVDAPGFRAEGPNKYTTLDGLHVSGLVQRILGAYDSQEFLRRRLQEHGKA